MMNRSYIILAVIILGGIIYSAFLFANLNTKSENFEENSDEIDLVQILETKLKYYESLLNSKNSTVSTQFNWHRSYAKEIGIMIQRIEGDNFCDNRFGFRSLKGFEGEEINLCSSNLNPYYESNGNNATVICRKNKNWNKDDGYCFTNLPISVNSNRNIGIHCRISESFDDSIGTFPTYSNHSGMKGLIGHLQPFYNQTRQNNDEYKVFETLEDKSSYLQLGCDSYSNDVAVFVKRSDTLNQFHKLAEFISTYVTLLSHGYEEGSTQVIFLDDYGVGYDNEVWRAITGKNALHYSQIEKKTCFKSGIFSHSAEGGPLWEYMKRSLSCNSGNIWKGFEDRMAAYFKLPLYIDSDEQTILFIDQKENGKIENYDELIKIIEDSIAEHKNFVKLNLKRVILEDLSYRKQIHLIRSSSIMIGLSHTNLTHVMFLQENGFLIELTPKGSDFQGYRNLAKWTGKGHVFIQAEKTESELKEDNPNMNENISKEKTYKVDGAIFKKAIASAIVSIGNLGSRFAALSNHG